MMMMRALQKRLLCLAASAAYSTNHLVCRAIIAPAAGGFMVDLN
jgi:hypothetical protein